MKKIRIVIVEDNLIIRMTFEEILSSINYDIIGLAANAKDALDLILSRKPDLVLIDIGLSGGLDGIDVISKVKSHYQPYVVFITGNSDKETRSRAEAINPQCILTKPIDSHQLEKKFKKIYNELISDNSKNQ